MKTQGVPLVLGFVGEATVHRETAFALIEDLIATYLRDNKRAKVIFVVAIDKWTTTIDDLCDFALVNKHDLELVGHDVEYQNDTPVEAYSHNATITAIDDDANVAVEVVHKLSDHLNSRVIFITDLTSESVDHGYYAALELASEKSIPCRSLLDGLDLIVLVDPNKKEGNTMATKDFSVEDIDEDIDEDVDDLYDEDDEDEDVLGEFDEEEFDEGPEQQVDEGEFDEEELDEEITEDYLISLAASDKKAFYEIAAEFGVFPGPGMKVPVMINKIFGSKGSAGEEVEKPKNTRPVTKSATLKEVPAKKAPVKNTATVQTPPAPQQEDEVSVAVQSITEVVAVIVGKLTELVKELKSFL